MTRPMVFARSLDKIIVLALLKLHRSQPRSKTIVERREICPHIFPSILKALKSSTSANVRMLGNRLEPLLQHDVFERRQNGSSSLPISPHIHIFDVSSYPDTIEDYLGRTSVIRLVSLRSCAADSHRHHGR